MEQHLAHQDEERDGGQREAGDRLHGVARELGEAGLAAQEQDRPDDVEHEEREGDRKAEPHHRDQAAEQQDAPLDPVHQLTDVASTRRTRSPRIKRSKRKTNSIASRTKVAGSGASNHHSGNTRFLMVIALSRQLS